jgi:hypothetical protein
MKPPRTKILVDGLNTGCVLTKTLERFGTEYTDEVAAKIAQLWRAASALR